MPQQHPLYLQIPCQKAGALPSPGLVHMARTGPFPCMGVALLPSMLSLICSGLPVMSIASGRFPSSPDRTNLSKREMPIFSFRTLFQCHTSRVTHPIPCSLEVVAQQGCAREKIWEKVLGVRCKGPHECLAMLEDVVPAKCAEPVLLAKVRRKSQRSNGGTCSLYFCTSAQSVLTPGCDLPGGVWLTCTLRGRCFGCI